MRRGTVQILCLLGALVALTPVVGAQEWPPLDEWERVEAHTTTVGGVPFTVGGFSYWVRAYRVNRVNYSKSIDRGPQEWHRVFGPNTPSSEKKPSERFFQSVPPLPPLAPFKEAAPKSLPALAQPEPLKPLAGDLPSIPAVPPLADF